MSDELSAALRELAAGHATPPTVDGAGVRARAMRRRRRRRAAYAVGAGTAALALLGLALTLHLTGDPDHPAGRRPPAAAQPHAPSAPPSTAAPAPVSGTLDLSGRTLTFDGRVMRFLSALGARAGSTGPMTVVTKQDPTELTLDVPSKGPVAVSVPYVVELRDRDGRTHYVGQYTAQLKALSAYDAKGSLLALGAEDAQWFYTRARAGDTLAVTTAPTPTTGPSAPSSRRAGDPSARG